MGREDSSDGVRQGAAAAPSARAPLSGTDWEDVEAFRAVAASLSFTEAARTLHVGRPVVSRRVQRLERALGAALLTRSTRSVQLTRAGSRVLRATDEMGSIWREALADVAASRGARPGQLRIAVHTSDVVRIVRTLSGAFPDVGWQTQTYLEEDSLAALAGGDLDVLTGYGTPQAGLPEVPGARFALLVEEPVWLAVAAGGRLARRTAGLAVRDLRNEGWVAHPLPVLRRLLDDACSVAGFVPDVRHVTADATAIRRLVATGTAVSLAAPTAVPGDDVAILPLLDGPRRTLFVGYRSGALGRCGSGPDGDPTPELVTALRSWYAQQVAQAPRSRRLVRTRPEDFPGVVP